MNTIHGTISKIQKTVWIAEEFDKEEVWPEGSEHPLECQEFTKFAKILS